MTFKEIRLKYDSNINPLILNYNGNEFITFRRASDRDVAYRVDFYKNIYYINQFYNIEYQNFKDMEKEFPYDDYEICDDRTILATGRLRMNCDNMFKALDQFKSSLSLNFPANHSYPYERTCREFDINSKMKYYMTYVTYKEILKDNEYRLHNNIDAYYIGNDIREDDLFIKLYSLEYKYNPSRNETKFISQAFAHFMKHMCVMMNGEYKSKGIHFYYHPFKNVYQKRG